MKVTKPMLIIFYAVIGAAGLILASMRLLNGLYLNSIFGLIVFAFCSYRLFMLLRG